MTLKQLPGALAVKGDVFDVRVSVQKRPPGVGLLAVAFDPAVEAARPATGLQHIP
jgi:hypothetical protein